jgi:hypothetical protein
MCLGRRFAPLVPSPIDAVGHQVDDRGGHNMNGSLEAVGESKDEVGVDTIAIMRFDEDMAEILRDLPGSGPLFPYLRTVRAGDRATEFRQRCVGLGIKGVSLHSYRYAWGERAKSAGYPERYAQVNLGHNSKAMTRAYSRKAEVEMPSLSEYERQQKAIIGNHETEPVTQSVAA